MNLKKFFILNIFSPVSNIDPLNSMMTNLFIEILDNSLVDTIYFTHLAGLQLDLFRTEYGFRVSNYTHAWLDCFSCIFKNLFENLTKAT